MKKDKVITLITIIAVIAITGLFFGVHYLMDAYVKYQRKEQPAAASGNQVAVEQQSGNQIAVKQQTCKTYRLIREIIESPEIYGVCGENLKWYYKDEVLVITGTGKMYEYTWFTNMPWYDRFKNQLSCVILDKGVTSVGSNAFSFCGSLREVILPDGVTDIGGRAFSYCHDLREITLPDTVTNIGRAAFFGCDGLCDIVIPDGVTSIGECIFYDCISLREITLPDTITGIARMHLKAAAA